MKVSATMAKQSRRLKAGQQQPQPSISFEEYTALENDLNSAMQYFGVEIANRRRDPYEINFKGIIESADPLAREKNSTPYDLYSDLMRDGKVLSCYNKRASTVTAYPWQVVPVDKNSAKGQQDAETITEILKQVNFDQVCKGLLDAIIIGMSVAEVVWNYKDGYIVPERIVKKAQRRFRYVDVEENEPPQLRLITLQNMLQGLPLPDKKFIVHRHGMLDDNPYGQGLGLQLYWPVFFKRCSIIAWSKMNDRFGMPAVWGRYPPNSGRDVRQKLLKAIKAFSTDTSIVTTDGTQIQLLEASLSGNVTSHKALCDYTDNWIAAVLTGENSPTNSGGAQAAASVERRSLLLDFVQDDSDQLSDTLNTSLMPWLCEYNGFEPCQVSRQIVEEKDLVQQAEIDTKLYAMNYRRTLASVIEIYGEGYEEAPQNAYGNNPYLGLGGFNSLSASFAEAQRRDGVELIDKQVQDMDAEDMQDIMAGIMQPMLDAINNSNDYEEALAALQNQFPKIDSTQLEAMLAQFMFGSQLLGRGVDSKAE